MVFRREEKSWMKFRKEKDFSGFGIVNPRKTIGKFLLQKEGEYL